MSNKGLLFQQILATAPSLIRPSHIDVNVEKKTRMLIKQTKRITITLLGSRLKTPYTKHNVVLFLYFYRFSSFCRNQINLICPSSPFTIRSAG